MIVKAARRGLFAHRVIEAGTEFDCPEDQLALLANGPAGEQLGWMEPTTAEGRALAARLAKRPLPPAQPPPPAPAGCADGLWPVGYHASYDRRIP
jgi:hypothetical protein